MFAYTLTPNSINTFVGGKPYTVDKTHVNFAAICDKIKRRPALLEQQTAWLEELKELIDVRAFIAKVTEGRVQVSDDTVLFNGKTVHGLIRDRLLAHLSEGYDIHPLTRFLDKLMDNPTESSRDDLYRWLEHSKMPITADGDFLAYKYVSNDYSSVHDRTTMHNIGNVVEMPREECDTDRNETCSSGLHFCSYDYVAGHSGSRHRQMVLKINPRDVTAIPSDYHNAKGRACRYEVIAEVEQEQKFPPLVNSFGTYEDRQNGQVSQLAKHYGDGDETHFEMPGDDHWDHSGCGCDGPNLEGSVVLDAGPPVNNRSVTGDDRIYDDEPVFKVGAASAFTATNFIRAVERSGQRQFSRDNGVARSTLQGWLRKAQAWINKSKRKKK